MKVLILGGGAREHALAWKLTQDDPSIDLLVAPGNAGIAELARCVPLAATDISALSTLAKREKVAFTLVGPEGPLADGVVDEFHAQRLPIFGPTRDAAMIEASKSFAKTLMVEAGVPTARATQHTAVPEAKRAVRALDLPVVIKASGLAAGKGVTICHTLAEADDAIVAILLRGDFGDDGRELLVEEFMEGEELSLFALTDGSRVIPMIPVQDHKRLLDGDEGPNTGGMGAYAPVSIGNDALVSEVIESIIAPTLAALRERGRPFAGLLYAGLMITQDGPKVVEFNCRFGDPETEAVLPLLDSSLLEPLGAIATEGGVESLKPLRWKDEHSVTIVISTNGYPSSPKTGDAITLPSGHGDVLLFHGGTSKKRGGELLTSGGRVFAVTGKGGSIEEARGRCLAFAQEVDFKGRHFRTDIGWREVARHARAT
jgi:phosphoribosylamine--glycine ligase